MTDPRQFAIVEYWGHIPPKHSYVHGCSSLAEAMEHIPDSKTVRQKLAIMNDAAHAEGTLASIRDRERAATAREDAVTKREEEVAARELADAIRKLDAVATRMDDKEEQERAATSAAEYALPPGASDEGEAPHGELTTHPASTPEDEEQLEATEDDDVDSEGELPKELLEEVPPVTGTDPEFPGPRQPEARNPVGISW